MSPSPMLWRMQEPYGGTEPRFSAYLTAIGTTLTVLCFGRVEEHGEPEASARETSARFAETGWASYTPITAEEIGGEEAFRYRSLLPRGPLTEWKFARNGWLFAAGVFGPDTDEEGALQSGRRVFDTWQWLD